MNKIRLLNSERISQLIFRLKVFVNQRSLLIFFVGLRIKDSALKELYSYTDFEFNLYNNLATLRIDNKSVDLNYSILLAESSSGQNFSRTTDNIRYSEIELFFLQ